MAIHDQLERVEGPVFSLGRVAVEWSLRPCSLPSKFLLDFLSFPPFSFWKISTWVGFSGFFFGGGGYFTASAGSEEWLTQLTCPLPQHSPLFNFWAIPSPTMACHASAGSHPVLWPHLLLLFSLPLSSWSSSKQPSLWQLRAFIPWGTKTIFL